MAAKTVYFDTNVYIDVFEGRNPKLLPQLTALYKTGKIQVVVSDLNLMESLVGNQLPTFPTGIQNLLGFSPRWIYLTGTAAREVLTLWGDPKQTAGLPGVGTLLSWADIAPLIIEEADLTNIAGILAPTPVALLQAYPQGSVANRLNFWKAELTSLQGELKKMMVYVLTPENVFRKLVAGTLQRNLGSTRAFADMLLSNPDLSPAYRLDVELNCVTLNVSTPKWTTNNFLDHTHAGALAYTDLFVTNDGIGKQKGLIQKIEWYDHNVRLPRGKAPYMDRLCRGWPEFVKRV